jgi:alpha-amylase
MIPLRLRLAVAGLTLAAVAAHAAPAPRVSLPPPSQEGSGQVFYFVLTDRFANGRSDNDTGGIPGGRNDHGFDPTAVSHFHGGDLAGLMARLDYLKGLGTTAIWLTPPFRNKPVQSGTAGYHGYWILDFLGTDPHLGTDEEFSRFVREAHARGIKVFMDVILNHTADVIMPEGGDVSYRNRKDWPYRDAQGRPFDEEGLAWNGIGEPKPFPELSPDVSFAHRPVVPAAEAGAKSPAWLNDARFYHNRGNTDFTGEKSLHGDFVGLDDLFTEHPEVVKGMIDIYRHWIERHGVDGFRIDTAKHTNIELWQAFGPAMRAAAKAAGRPGFFSFGEVATGDVDTRLLSEFSTLGALDASLDFAFAIAARDFVGRGGAAAALGGVFENDDHYTDHDSTAQSLPTFLGNHDQGRVAYFLKKFDPTADDARLLALSKLAHALLFLARGQPVLYYGDEQGLVGRGGDDMRARESLFAAQAPEFRSATLLGTSRTGADDKYDPEHPLYRHFAGLAALRKEHPAFVRGAMLLRSVGDPRVFAFSRVERGEQIEYVVALGNQREGQADVAVPTSQPAGAGFRLVYGLGEGAPAVGTRQATGADGRLACRVPALGVVVWRAEARLPASVAVPQITFAAPTATADMTFGTRVIDGQALSERQEVRAVVTGGDGVAEVTFLASRESRPGSWEYLGTDDAPPYRVFWRPPADWKPWEKVTFAATVDNLRGGRRTVELAPVKAALPSGRTGFVGASVPILTRTPAAVVRGKTGSDVVMTAEATGVPAPDYQWYRDGAEIPGATAAELRLPFRDADDGARISVVARNVAGAAVSSETVLRSVAGGEVVRLAPLASRHVPERPVDVWLPPGYAESPERRYPVVYLHDGQNLFDGERSISGAAWEIDRAMARLIREKRAKDAILVGVWNAGDERWAEYFPQKALAYAAPGEASSAMERLPGDLRGDAYLRFLVEELKPVIDRTFRTLPDRANTFIMGSSMGGLASANAVAEYPAVFGGAACLSTHWPPGGGVAIEHLRRRFPRAGEHRFYFDHGTVALDAAYAPHQRRMDEAMRALGYREGRDWVTRVFEGADHSERAWRARVEEPLAFLLR